MYVGVSVCVCVYESDWQAVETEQGILLDETALCLVAIMHCLQKELRLLRFSSTHINSIRAWKCVNIHKYRKIQKKNTLTLYLSIYLSLPSKRKRMTM